MWVPFRGRKNKPSCQTDTRSIDDRDRILSSTEITQWQLCAAGRTCVLNSNWDELAAIKRVLFNRILAIKANAT